MESGRNLKETVRYWTMPLGVNSEEKLEYTDGDTLWGVSGLSLILGSPALALYTENMKGQ